MSSRCAYDLRTAEVSDITWIADLEARLYDPDCAVPYEILRQWFDVNPCGFWIILQNGMRIGNINVLPIREPSMNRLLQRLWRERDIRGSDLHPPGEQDRVRVLYVENVAVAEGGAFAAGRAIQCLVVNVRQVLGSVSVESEGQKIYTSAATVRGRQLIERVGFVAVPGQPLFVIDAGHLRHYR